MEQSNPYMYWSLFLHSRFELKHGDGDILTMLEHTVPAPDLTKISIFSAHLAKYSQEALLNMCVDSFVTDKANECSESSGHCASG